MWWSIALSAAFGYGLGSVQFGLIVGRLSRGVDIRDYGSGATGATNVIRTAGAWAGLLVIALDISKGLLPVYTGIALGHAAGLTHNDGAWVAAAGASGAVLGHVWPLWFGFRGGKAVATGFGATLAMNPLAAAALVPVAAIVVGSVRIMSVMSIVMPPLMAALFVALAARGISPPAYAAFAVPAAALIIFKHRTNIGRLLAGTEPRIGSGGERRSERTRVGSR